MITLDDVTVSNDLRARLALITPEQVAACGRRLKKDPAKGKLIGTVESPTTRALYALWTSLDAEEALELAKAQGAVDAAIEKEHTERAALLDMFSDVAREMFWAQAKIDIGFYERASVCIREGWELVNCTGGMGGAGNLFASLMGGAPPSTL